MSAFDGLEAVADGDGAWRILETGRPEPEGRIALVTGEPGSGFTVSAEGDAPPPGPYGTLGDAVQAIAIWRNARFEGDRR